VNAQTAIKPAGLDLLREPFPAHQISKLPKGGIFLDYVGHAALTDRLLDADPNWTWEPLAFDPNGLPAYDQNGGLWIKLTVCGMTRLGYGHAGTKKGGDAIKELIGDALRNAAMRFGAALDLWHKGDLHADEEQAGGAQQTSEVSPPAVITAAQWGILTDLIEKTKADAKAFCAHFAIASVKDMPANRFDEARALLNKKLAGKAPKPADAYADIDADSIPY